MRVVSVSFNCYVIAIAALMEGRQVQPDNWHLFIASSALRVLPSFPSRLPRLSTTWLRTANSGSLNMPARRYVPAMAAMAAQ